LDFEENPIKMLLGSLELDFEENLIKMLLGSLELDFEENLIKMLLGSLDLDFEEKKGRGRRGKGAKLPTVAPFGGLTVGSLL
jgi:hypothetical protein